MATAKLHAADGSFKSDVELPVEFFGVEVSKACIYLAVNAYLANQRQGTAKTKTRSEINGSGAKPWKQKGSGRARSGTNSSPIWVRGNKAHGPKARSYNKKVNKKVKRKAFLSALTAKAADEAIVVFETLSFNSPKTTELLSMYAKSGLEQRNTLFVTAPGDENVLLTARNIPWAKVVRAQDLNTYDLVRARNIVFSQAALDAVVGGEK